MNYDYYFFIVILLRNSFLIYLQVDDRSSPVSRSESPIL